MDGNPYKPPLVQPEVSKNKHKSFRLTDSENSFLGATELTFRHILACLPDPIGVAKYFVA